MPEKTKNLMFLGKLVSEEEILEHYERYLNWGVKMLRDHVEKIVSNEDIKQEGRLAIMKLIRKYDPKIGTLDGYIKSYFYATLKRSLKINKKRPKIIFVNERIDDCFFEEPKFERQMQNKKRLELIKSFLSNYEYRKILNYYSGNEKYKNVKSIISKVRRRLIKFGYI